MTEKVGQLAKGTLDHDIKNTAGCLLFKLEDVGQLLYLADAMGSEICVPPQALLREYV